MLRKTEYCVPSELLAETADFHWVDENKNRLNSPTGSFFYDPWVIADMYKGTVWEQILSTLPGPVGEARIMVLKPGTCYHLHADIDDRYHLNISGLNSYLIDFDTQEMHKLVKDGIWYDMNAGRLHSAANFDKTHRVQLVVRKLMHNTILPIRIRVSSDGMGFDDARNTFDSILSPWLNNASKRNLVGDFKTFAGASVVEFSTTDVGVEEVKQLLIPEFKLEFV